MSSTPETPFVVEPELATRLRGYYHEAPTGPIGIFVHGFLSDSGGTKSMALAEHARAQGRAWLRFDQRGHGSSDGTVRALRLSRLRADLEAVVDAFAPRRVILVGSSMGGWLSVLAAQARPAQVAGLLLIAPAFNFIRHHFRALPAKEREAWARAGVRRFDSRYGGPSYELEYGVVADAEDLDVLQGPLALACPVVVVHGEQDEAVPVSISEDFIARGVTPYCEFHRIPGGDHRLNSALPLLQSAVDTLWDRASR